MSAQKSGGHRKRQNRKSKPKIRQALLECLQGRLLLSGTSAVAPVGLYTVEGTGGGDLIVISYSNGELIQSVNGVVQNIDASQIDSLLVNAGDGRDSVRIMEGLPLSIATITVDAGAGDDRVGGSMRDELIYGMDGDDRLHGGEGNDTIYGGAGRDHIFAEDGDDRVKGGAHNDRIFGNDGEDFLYGDGGHDYIDNGQNADHTWGGAGNDYLTSTGRGRNWFWGDDGDDHIYSGPAPDMVFGGAGNDLLETGQSVDSVWGEAGNDTLNGNSAFDFMDGGPGNDFGYADLDDTITSLETIRFSRRGGDIEL
jgi:Ca2+-binding RTX toxin-like protein